MEIIPNHIFISYSSIDLVIVSLAIEKIEKEKIIIWRDRINLDKNNLGEYVWEEIEKKIAESEYFIIFLSRDSIYNKNVIRELKKAKVVLKEENKSKNFIIPVILDEYVIKEGVKDELGNPLLEFIGDNCVQGIKFYRNYKDGIDVLLNFLLRKLKKPIFELDKIKRGPFSYKFFYKLDDNKRFIIFRTFFLLDTIHDTGKLINWKLNPFNFHPKRYFSLEGSYFTVKLEITFNPYLSTISDIKPFVISILDV